MRAAARSSRRPARGLVPERRAAHDQPAPGRRPHARPAATGRRAPAATPMRARRPRRTTAAPARAARRRQARRATLRRPRRRTRSNRPGRARRRPRRPRPAGLGASLASSTLAAGPRRDVVSRLPPPPSRPARTARSAPRSSVRRPTSLDRRRVARAARRRSRRRPGLPVTPAAIELAAGGRAERRDAPRSGASERKALKSPPRSSISAIRPTAAAGSPFSTTSPVGRSVPGSIVSTHTPSNGTTRARIRAAPSEKSRSPYSRWTRDLRSARRRWGDGIATYRSWSTRQGLYEARALVARRADVLVKPEAVRFRSCRRPPDLSGRRAVRRRRALPVRPRSSKG